MSLSDWRERSIAATELAMSSFGSSEISRASSWTKMRKLGLPFALPGTSEDAIRLAAAGGARIHFRVQNEQAFLLDYASRSIPDISAASGRKWRNAGSRWATQRQLKKAR